LVERLLCLVGAVALEDEYHTQATIRAAVHFANRALLVQLPGMLHFGLEERLYLLGGRLRVDFGDRKNLHFSSPVSGRFTAPSWDLPWPRQRRRHDPSSRSRPCPRRRCRSRRCRRSPECGRGSCSSVAPDTPSGWPSAKAPATRSPRTSWPSP